MAILSFGSLNSDLLIQAPHLPAPGETLTGRNFQTLPGGKGANQAVAAARLGSPTQLTTHSTTHLIGRVGSDDFGTALLQSLQAAQVQIDGIDRDPTHPTGVALITVSDGGENQIVLAPGANGQVGAAEVARLQARLAPGDILLLQLEVPLEAVVAAAKVARAIGATIILDPAPAIPALPDELWPCIDWLTPNQGEAAVLWGQPIPSPAAALQAAAHLRLRGAQNVVVTLGALGAVAILAEDPVGIVLDPYGVNAIDSTAAGDAFNGALAVALAEGLPGRSALCWAMAAGALATTRAGAQPALPKREEVLALM